MAKKVSIMQPYLFPYLGYFQMISAADTFVLYDDVQFISRGWIHRNKILINGDGGFITWPIKKDHYALNINQRFFSDDLSGAADKILKAIHLSYARAPHFKNVYPLLEKIIRIPEKNVALYVEKSIRRICEYLDIPTRILVSSRLGIGNQLHAKERVMAIVRELEGTISINPIGGVEMYSCDEFAENGIGLRFIRMHDIRYQQYGSHFVPNLSIIDVLMFNSPQEVREKLSLYSLEDNFENPVPL